MKSISVALIALFAAVTSAGAFACTTLGSYDDAWITAPRPAPATPAPAPTSGTPVPPAAIVKAGSTR